MMDARHLAQVIAEAIEPMLRAVIVELTEWHAATLREYSTTIAQLAQLTQALRPRRDGATIATDCAGVLAEVQRVIEPGGARRAYDCAGAVREVENEIEWGKIHIERRKQTR